MKPQFKIGTKFKRNHKKYIETVIDILTTTNHKGEVVKIVYVAEHEFIGSKVIDYEVPQAAIARGLIENE